MNNSAYPVFLASYFTAFLVMYKTASVYAIPFMRLKLYHHVSSSKLKVLRHFLIFYFLRIYFLVFEIKLKQHCIYHVAELRTVLYFFQISHMYINLYFYTMLMRISFLISYIF